MAIAKDCYDKKNVTEGKNLHPPAMYGDIQMVALNSLRSETLRFAKLGVAISVDRIDSETTLVEVTMPEGLFSEKFDDDRWPVQTGDDSMDTDPSTRRHSICNRLHMASLSLDVLSRCCRDDAASEVEHILEMAVESLSELEELASF